MKEILRFKCAPNAHYSIMMVSEGAARSCLVDSAYSSSAAFPAEGGRKQRSHGAAEGEGGAKQIGLCGPNTGDPKVGVRAYSPIPDRPTFQEGRSYYLISESFESN